MKNMHVLLLCGGGGAEHEVSLRSANFLEQQLGLLPGVEVTRVEMFADRWLSADGRECKLGLDKLLSFDSVARPVDYVVPCIHGYPGETGDLQSFLELAGLPYLGCDAEASKICFNKISTKLWLSAIGIPNTPYLFLTEQNEAALAEAKAALANCNQHVRTAILMLMAGLDAWQARDRLAENNDRLRLALQETAPSSLSRVN